MAGDWMALRLDIHDDPAVILISDRTGIDIDAVVGKLARLWAWANRHLTDGTTQVSSSWVDQRVSATGFAAAMAEAGWLQIRSGLVRFPDFDIWNSGGAKKRLLDSKRKSLKRQDIGDNVRTLSASEADRNGTREEKRREEEIKNSLSPPASAQPEREKSEIQADDQASPKRRIDLSNALMLPPLVTEAMRAFQPEVQAQAWEITQAFIVYSPGRRSTQKLGEIAACFADAIISRPAAVSLLKAYFSVSDPVLIQAEFVDGKRLRPGASPWEICDWLFGQRRAPPPRKPDSHQAANERAKRLAAEADKPKPEQLAKLRSVTRNHASTATA